MMEERDIHSGDWYNLRLDDGGPVYAETNPDLFIVEPWNAFSSLVMMLPAIIWAVRLYPSYKEYLFLTLMLPLGFLGGLGSTLFHAFRAHQLFLLLDVLPSAILTLSLTVYLWLKVLKKWWYILIIVVISIGLRTMVFMSDLPEMATINISYSITGFLVGIPLIILMKKTKFYRISDVLIAIVSFALALLFRELDSLGNTIFPMGTHFLWHVLSAVGSYFVFSYLYFLRSINLRSIK